MHLNQTGAYYTEWSKSEQKTPTYTNASMWNLERCNNEPICKKEERHRCIEQSFGLCERRRGWDDLRDQHWNMYIIICERDHQSRFNAWDKVLRSGALGWTWGMAWGGRWGGVQDGEHMHTHGWFMSMYGKTHYNTVK